MLSISITIQADDEKIKQVTDFTLNGLLETFSFYSQYSAHFSESKKMDFLEINLEIEGELIFKKPNYLKRTSEPPYEEIIEIKGDQVTLKRKDKAVKIIDLKQYPAIESFVAVYRSILSGNHRQLEKHYVVELSGTQENWRLELKPKNNKLQQWFTEIILFGQENKINIIEFYDINGDKTLIKLSKHHYV